MNTKIALAVALALASTGAVAGELKQDAAGAATDASSVPLGTKSQAGMTDPAASDQPAAMQEQGMAPGQDPSAFTELDKDGDGYISETEASSELKNQWAELDENTDNQLDQTEFARFEQDSAGTDTGTSGVTPAQGSKSQPGMQGNKKTY